MKYLTEFVGGKNWGEYAPLMKRLTSWQHWDICLAALRDIKREVLYKSHIHGGGHIERTVLYGSILAMDVCLPPEDLRLLLLCCSYHDIGRVNDLVDDLHGARSAAKAEAITGLSGEELRIVMAAMEYHSVDDRLLEKVMEKHSVTEKDRCVRIAKLLKDADGLDRVRLGLLDVRYLRNPTAPGYKPFAEYVFSLTGNVF